MKPIFNSLGSNYTPEVISLTKRLLKNPDHPNWLESHKLLVKLLDEMFSGTSFLFYKGRHAITSALRVYGIGTGDLVIIQAFTCWAVEEAVHNSGAKPVFADTKPQSLNLSLSSIKKVYKQNPEVKAIIIQHTLGYAVETKKIYAWCKHNNIILIEDLAHAYAASDANDDTVGTNCDAVALSFGRDKVIDAVTGGALVIKTKPKSKKPKQTNTLAQNQSTTKNPAKTLLYPIITSLIRNTYPYPGKIIHLLATKVGLIKSPITSETDTYTPLPPVLSHLALDAIERAKAQHAHRQNIANIYHTKLKRASTLITLSDIKSAANLRYPILVKNRSTLLERLKSEGFYLYDIWYKNPVDTGRLARKSTYQTTSCPNAENLSKTILNLPTHINISTKQAKKLAELINQYS